MGVSQVMNTVRTEVSVPDPLDPFGFEEESQSEPIDDEERAALLDDLADLAEFREALEPRGFRGVVIPCPDCEEDHFFSWSLLRPAPGDQQSSCPLPPPPPAVGPACLQGVIFFPQIVPLCGERPCGTGSSTLRFPSRPSRCSPASRSPAAG